MEADFLAKLEATPQKVLLQFRRQEALIDPQDRPPVPAWKKIRGPPKSLKEDEEHEPIRSVLVRLLKIQNSGNGSGVAEQCIGKKASATQEIEAHETSKTNAWFDIEDVCKFFDELQVFYNPEDLAFLETLTVVKNAEEEAVVSEENYLFVDSLDDIEVIIDFHTAVCSVQTIFIPHANRERTILVLGPMETCMQVAVKEPLQNVHNGCQFLDKFCDIARSFIDATEKSESTASRYGNAKNSFVNFYEKILPQMPMRALERVIRENIAKLISKHSGNKDPAGISDAKFSWKVLVLDPNDELKVGETRAEDESPSTEVPDFQDDNELTYSVVRGIVAYQALFRGHFARRILRSANFPLSEDCLNETTDSEKANLFRSIQRQLGCRCLPDDANFFTRRLQTGTFSDISAKPVGCIWSAPANYVQSATRKQYLYPLFYQTIHISEELTRFRIHLKSDEGVARVIVIDNDSGCAIESKKDYYFALEVNRLGYCLLAYVLSEDQVDSNSNWQFSCLCEGWRELNFPKMHSSFAFWEANGVLEADDDGLLFRFSLDITLRQVVSLALKIGNPTVSARLILRSSDGSELANAHEEPGGAYLMSALLLGPDLNLEEGGVAMKCDSLGVRREDNKDAKATKALEGSDNCEECKEVCKELRCT
ncbi:hypothetical protein TSMEX_007802 [Taenia solium]|eukprot:TsM_000306900 transcript=TsM_000306900 gene=TsM_000306900